jgi:transposase
MRGEERQQSALFSYISPESRVPASHPLRRIRALMDQALVEMGPQFDALYASGGRPSIPPEQLLRALLLQVLYTVRSERQLMEQLDYNILFRWFVGLGLDEPIWDVTVFTKNRERLLVGEVAQALLTAVLGHAQQARLLSNEHFTVDGTLVQAWAGQKSFQRRTRRGRRGRDDDPGNPTVDFHGERRSNTTHASTTDPEAQLAKRGPGQEAKLAYHGHVLMDNRYGLAVAACVTAATGTAETTTAVALVHMLAHRHQRITVGGDKGYDTRACVAALRAAGVTPHIAQRSRYSALDDRTARHPGYAVSQRVRKRVEEIFGWLKTIGLQRQTRFRGTTRVNWMFTFATAVYDLVRMQRLLPAEGVP